MPTGVYVRRPTSPELRFWRKVVCVIRTRCWVWTGAGSSVNGYGQFWLGRLLAPHIWAYESLVGPVPDGLELDHLCRNRRCVNPEHLEAVTHQVNVLRGASPLADQARQTLCKYGHPLDGGNLYVYRGRRSCRICIRRRLAESEARLHPNRVKPARKAKTAGRKPRRLGVWPPTKVA